MPLATVRAVLIADAAVVALVPAARIEPLRRTQTFDTPAITLQVVSKTPFNHLLGASLDLSLVQLDCWASNYTAARAVADACRAALETPVLTMQGEIDGGLEPDTDPELFRVTQTWSVYTS